MKHNKTISALLLIVLIFNIFSVPVHAITETQNTVANNDMEVLETNESSNYNDDNNSMKQKYLIKYNNKDKKFKEKVEKKIKDKGGKILKELDKLNILSVELTEDDYKNLRNDTYITLIEPDYTIETQEETIPWGVKSIKATSAHGQEVTGAGINVAIFDTGISPHPDLNIKGGVSFVDGVHSYYDDNGHGTHIAGTIGALLNGKGILGVAPLANIYSVKTIAADGRGSYSSIIEGINWAIENNINVINMSFGGSNYSKILEEAINLAYENNILIIASAGNSGLDITYPAKFNNVIAVGAIDENEIRADFSSFGTELELMAPGVNTYSTLNKGDYGSKSGTSMAAAYVSGAAALIWSVNPVVSNENVRDVLMYSAMGLGDHNYYGNGLVDVEYALSTFEKYRSNDTKNDSLSKIKNVKRNKLDSEDKYKKEKQEKEKDKKDKKSTEDTVVINHGNSFSNATTINVNTNISGTIGVSGERDYFRFTAPTSGSYTIETTGSTDTFGHLYNSSQTQIATDDDSGEGNNFTISQNLIAGQTYFIQVRHFSTGTGAYVLRVNAPVPADDHGNNFSTATSINVNTNVAGAINYGGDEDFFRFTASTTGSYTIETTGSIDTFGHLYNSSQTQIATDDDSGDGNNFRITQNLTAGQTYFIKVRHFNTSGTGSYTLRVSPTEEWYYAEIETDNGDVLKVYMNNLGESIETSIITEARVVHNNSTLLSTYRLINDEWYQSNVVAYRPGGTLLIADVGIDENIINSVGISSIKVIDINDIRNKMVNKIEDFIGIPYSSLNTNDKKMVQSGIVHSIDNNMFFGLAQKIVNVGRLEHNYYYMRAKSLMDAFFVAKYTIATAGSVQAAMNAWSAAGISGGLAIATSPSGAGTVVFGATAATSLAGAVTMTGVSFVSASLTTRSTNNFRSNIQKLQDTLGYKLRNLKNNVLTEMEKIPDCHTIKEHVNITDDGLLARGVNASKYHDLDKATRAVKEAVLNNADDVEAWLRNTSSPNRLIFDTTHSFDLGYGYKVGTVTKITNLRTSRIVIEKSNAFELGFKIITSYPILP